MREADVDRKVAIPFGSFRPRYFSGTSFRPSFWLLRVLFEHRSRNAGRTTRTRKYIMPSLPQ